MRAETITTSRLILEPLTAGHAAEMARALRDPALHEFIGGSPATEEELRSRYARMAAGPPPGGDDAWLNWVVRLDRAVGCVQATVTSGRAAVAWVVGVPWQGRGIATEAARALVAWLGEHGVTEIVATIHPGHAASSAVARRLGLVPTDDRVDGEVVWRSPPSR
ncbi:GNAT family N-acetyltransferase [Streptosporangium carneum]|uniref:Acetyltransferase n=1 Tax=Streptosporangium carneum TaxID=47481 RepID=A0A9W6I2Q5_9ACTN|nr:GNAT family N-acetyltransferase [Streptosporangium carneum]GLK10326.1 acetyltransferase [Streptosporangium carneum]